MKNIVSELKDYLRSARLSGHNAYFKFGKVHMEGKYYPREDAIK